MQTSKLKYLYVIVAVAICGAALVISHAVVTHAQAKAPLHVRWVIAHEPVSLFERPAREFTKAFNALSDRPIVIDVLGPKDFGSTSGRLLSDEVLGHLQNGDVELATVGLNGIAETVPEVSVLSLPFLFKDYASVEKAFDGPIGAKLLNDITEKIDGKALAFTFSGGYEIIQSNTMNFRDADAFKGKNIGTINGNISVQNLSPLGAHVELLDNKETNTSINDSLDSFDGIETTYTRLTPIPGHYPAYVSETNHSLYITSIIASS